MFRAGLFERPDEFPAKLGYSASGIVEALGDGVHRLRGRRRGQHGRYGVYGEAAIVPASAVLRRPEGLGAAEAVALWGPFVTAYGALVDEGHVRPGDFVLITAASSSVGLATIDVANHIGAIPIAATRTAAKKQRLLDAGAAHVIVTDDEDIAERTLEITGNKGAQFVFDAVAGEGRDARRLRRARHEGNAVPAVVRADHAAVQRVRPDPGRRPPRPRGALRPRRRPSRDVRPRVDRTFDLTAIADAHRYLEANGQFGKVVVTMGG